MGVNVGRVTEKKKGGGGEIGGTKKKNRLRKTTKENPADGGERRGENKRGIYFRQICHSL